MSNPMLSDFLAFLPVIIQRLGNVEGVKKVFTTQELSDLDVGKNIAPIDGCVYVMLDGYSPNTESGNGKNQAIDVTFSVILAKQYYNKTSIGDVGITLTNIAKSLIGYEPMNEKGQNLTLAAIYLDKGLNVLYQKGFALYPLRFKTVSVITID